MKIRPRHLLLVLAMLPWWSSASAQRLLSERTQRSANGVTHHVRDIELVTTGERVSLAHLVQPDGTLLLRSADQSTDTMQTHDRYCEKWGGTTSRMAEARFPTPTVMVLPCIAESPPASRSRRPRRAG